MAREPLVAGYELRMYFVGGGLSRRRVVRAVDGVTVEIRRGETLGLVGESGSGKSTLGRLLLRVYKPTAGRVFFNGIDITDLPERKLRPLRRQMQLVPQDPYASFNPLQRIGDAIAEPLIVHGLADESEAREAAFKMLERVGLVPPEDYYYRYPSQLSGGQLQRAAIARAMILEPSFVVADEPTSSLDVSIRASILELLKEFKERLRQAMLFITHDLAVAKLISDTIAVMYLGKIVEVGPADKVLRNPLHPYTLALLTAIPRLRPSRLKRRLALSGEIPDPSNPPPGCRLHPRCPLASPICSKEEPKLVEVENNHWVACFNPLKD